MAQRAPEGRIRDHVFTNHSWRDSLLYSVLEDEWDGSASEYVGLHLIRY
jgi:hypothetical protein